MSLKHPVSQEGDWTSLIVQANEAMSFPILICIAKCSYLYWTIENELRNLVQLNKK
jgi:hypothetical protein